MISKLGSSDYEKRSRTYEIFSRSWCQFLYFVFVHSVNAMRSRPLRSKRCLETAVSCRWKVCNPSWLFPWQPELQPARPSCEVTGVRCRFHLHTKSLAVCQGHPLNLSLSPATPSLLPFMLLYSPTALIATSQLNAINLAICFNFISHSISF